MVNWDRQTALVTGSATRIGGRLASVLAERGCAVAVHAHRSLDQGRELCERLAAAGARVCLLEGDLADPAVAQRLVQETAERLGNPTILVNNAAIFAKEDLWSLDAAALDRAWCVNTRAPVLLTQALARRGGEGCVVNLLDRRIACDDPGCLPYLLSKQALAAFTRSAALALAPRFRVNGIAPGPVLPPPGKGESYLHDHAGAMPLDIRCNEDDLAQALLYLVEARTVTGQILFVDSGQHLLGNALNEKGREPHGQ